MYGNNKVWTLQFHLQNGGMRESRVEGHRRDGTTEGVANGEKERMQSSKEDPLESEATGSTHRVTGSNKSGWLRGGWGAESVQG